MDGLTRNWIKVAIFCTGVTGIVAEYIMATLATYCLGDSVKQWTLVISLMLFAMGVGSQMSRSCADKLLDTFIFIEFALALLVSLSVIFIYTLFGTIEHPAFFIYLLAFTIGLLVGLELPLATRINAHYENLRINISSILSKDYLGALGGGIFFAFLALPYLGLTTSATAVGCLNFAVALALGWICRKQIKRGKTFIVSATIVGLAVILAFIFGNDIVLFSEQKRYQDKIVFQTQSRHQSIVLTNFQKDYWLYLNGHQQFSTQDEHRYHESLVHPAMLLSGKAIRVLVLGGGDGLAAREILRHRSVKKLTLVDLDPVMTDLARTHPLLVQINRGAMTDKRVSIVNRDAFSFLHDDASIYDVILADFPDPKTADLARLYSLQFFQAASRRLRTGGVFVTQAGSPIYARHAFQAILKTLRSLHPAVPLHTYLPTMGDWGWVVAMKSPISNTKLRAMITSISMTSLASQLRYLNAETLKYMTLGWGKDFNIGYDAIKINRISNLSLHRYYQDGQWSLY